MKICNRMTVFPRSQYLLVCLMFLSVMLMANSFAGEPPVSRPGKYLPLVSDAPSIPLIKGIHQYDTEQHQGYIKPLSEQPPVGLKPIPLNPQVTPGVNRIVFAYLPYWEDTNTKIDWIRYNLVTHIAWHSVAINSNGTITNSSGWPNTYLINKAHTYGTKVLLSATNFSSGATFLASASARYTSCTALLKLVQNAGADGITIDIEALSYSVSVQSTLTKYMQEISTTFHNANSNYHVSIAIEPLNTGSAKVFNLNDLANYCDSLFIMWYNFYYSGSGSTGPNDPFSRGGFYSSSYSMLDKVNAYIQQSNNRPEKIVLGLPLYALRWATTGITPHAATNGFIDNPRYSSLPMAGYTQAWDTASQTPWSYYGTLGGATQTWGGNPDSIGIRYDLINNLGLGGVGYWAFAYDYPLTTYWDVISTKFYNQSTTAQGIKNGSLDNARSNWANWEWSNSSMSITTSSAYLGGSAAMITQTSGSGAGFYQSDGRVAVGKTFTVSGWVYQNGFSTSSCNLGWAGTYSPYTKSPNNALVPSGGSWKHYFITQSFTNTTIGYRDVQLTLTGSGTAYLDDLGVIEGYPSSFYAESTEVFANQNIQFYDTSTDAVGWTWDFGDGNSSVFKDPIHAYSVTTDSWFTVKLIVTHTLASSTAIRTNYIHVIPVAWQTDFTVSSDTELFVYQIPEGKTQLPSRNWLSSYQGATGAMSFSFSSSDQGVKMTLGIPNWLACDSTQDYLVQARVCTDAPAVNGFSGALYLYNGIPPNPFDLSASVLPYNVPTNWTWMQVYLRSVNSAAGMYPQLVFKSESGSGNLYVDAIRVAKWNVPTLSSSAYPGGDWDSAADTTYWAFQKTADAVTQPAYYATSSSLRVDFSGSGLQGMKMTMSTTAGITYTYPITSGKRSGMSLNIQSSGVLNNALVAMILYGVDSPGSTELNEMIGTGSYNRLPVMVNSAARLTGFMNRPYTYGQLLLKNAGAGTLELDQLNLLSE